MDDKITKVKIAKLKDISQKEPNRVEYATTELRKLGYKTRWSDYDRVLTFKYKGNTGRIWPYTGWYAVKGIGSGRGVKNLIKKLPKCGKPSKKLGKSCKKTIDFIGHIIYNKNVGGNQ